MMFLKSGELQQQCTRRRSLEAIKITFSYLGDVAIFFVPLSLSFSLTAADICDTLKGLLSIYPSTLSKQAGRPASLQSGALNRRKKVPPKNDFKGYSATLIFSG